MTTQTSVPTAWAIVEEHLEEAAFLLEVRQSRLDVPDYSLEEVRHGPEARLLAHLDALAVGGEPVSERMLMPLLQDEAAEPAAVSVAALVLLQGGNPIHVEACVRALLTTRAEKLDALATALCLVGHPELPGRLVGALHQELEPATIAATLRVLTSYRVALGHRLVEWLQHPATEVVIAALELVARLPSPDLLPHCESLLDAEPVSVRDAAVRAAVTCGSTLAWQHCLQRAARALPEDASCQLLVGLIGRRQEQQLLLRALERGAHPEAALWACSFAGRGEHVDAAVSYLDHSNPLVVKSAGEVLMAVAGYQPDEAGIVEAEPDELPPFEEEDLNADLVPSSTELLPVFEPEAARRWWAEARHRFTRDARYVAGRVQCLEALLEALLQGPTRRRRAWARGVALASQGRHQLIADALYRRQKHQLERLRQADANELWRLLT